MVAPRARQDRSEAPEARQSACRLDRTVLVLPGLSVDLASVAPCVRNQVKSMPPRARQGRNAVALPSVVDQLGQSVGKAETGPLAELMRARPATLPFSD